MSKKANPKLIGGFVVGAVVLLTVGVILFGSGKFFAKKRFYVLFFPGSVKGLNVGANVILKGVKIGSVTDVKSVFNPETITFYSPVYIEILPDRIVTLAGVDIDKSVAKGSGDSHETVRILVDRGLRGKLELQSLVTGQLLVAFDMHPGTPANYVGLEKDEEISEIPTLPSDMEALAKTLENLDLKGIAEDVRKTLAGIEGLVNKPELAEAITNLNKTLEDFGKLARNVDSRVGPLATSVESTMKDAGKLVRNVDGQIEPLLEGAQSALQQAEKTLVAIEGMTSKNSALRNRIYETLTEVRGAARSMRVLADYLEQNPDSLLFGKGEPGGQ